MKIRNILIAIALILIPVLVRSLWFYQGVYIPGKELQEPDFLELSIQNPELSTPDVSQREESQENAIVVFDLAHSNQFQLAEIDIVLDEILWQGGTIATLDEDEDLQNLLKTASAFISIAPTRDFSEEEVQAVQSFVERGGRLVVIADPTRSSSEYIVSRAESVEIANKLLEPYHLTFRNDYAYNIARHEGNFRNVYLQPLARDTLTSGVDEVVMYAARTISSYEDNLLAGDADTLSSLTDTGGELSLAALSGDNVLALGDFTFLTSPYYQVADNYTFITNLVDFLMEAEREKTIEDFPFLFTRDIGILPSEDIELDNELVALISELKDLYAAQDLRVEFLEEDQSEYDLIILSLLPPSEDLDDYLSAFDIQFGASPRATNTPQPTPTLAEEIAETVTPTTPPTEPALRSDQIRIGGLGSVPQDEFAFFLLQEDNGRNILIILASDQTDLIDMLELMIDEDLSDCYTEDNITLCEQDGYRVRTTPTLLPEIEETEEPTTPTPEPTPETE